MKEQMMNTASEHGYRYICKCILTGEVYTDSKLPRILKTLREETNHTFKIPHGNKVRTLILEQGICEIKYEGMALYEITIERW